MENQPQTIFAKMDLTKLQKNFPQYFRVMDIAKEVKLHL